MAVLGLSAFAFEVPDIQPGVKFYTDAGLEATVEGQTARFRCTGRKHDCIFLYGGAARKRLHHVRLRADGLDEIAAKVEAGHGSIASPPPELSHDGLWLRDPHGVLFHLVEEYEEAPLDTAPEFHINVPGRTVRIRKSAVLPISSYPRAQPLRLGHVMLFTPDVNASVAFVTEVLGMGLADKSGDAVAFCCARKNSDHHVIAYGKSPGTGFHHGSFQVSDPDEVGRAGQALLQKSGRGDWGFGRHTIGSNFFHYIEDPWGSWFEYYADMDFIDDYNLWQPTDYPPEDSLASWAPELPQGFIDNREIELIA